MQSKTYERAKKFVYRNARPLDIARFQYHFEGGSQELVLAALGAYQNADGGFGHALELDSWNPNSSPVQTWVATEILKEVQFTDKGHPVIQGILKYLESGADFNGHVWFNTVRTNNDFPHAPWWHHESDTTEYAPTAALAGFALAYADKDSKLYVIATQIAKEAMDSYDNASMYRDMQLALCYMRLYEYAEFAGLASPEYSILKERLRRHAKTCITNKVEDWDSGYIGRPSQLFCSPGSVFYLDNKEAADYECRYIINTQRSDGSWLIQWKWRETTEEWAITKNWWKAHMAVLNLLYLKGFGKV